MTSLSLAMAERVDGRPPCPIVLQSRRGPTPLVYTGTIGLLTPAHVTCTLECHQSTPDNLFPVYSILSTLRPKFLLRTECISSLWATLNPRKVVFKLLTTMSTGSSFLRRDFIFLTKQDDVHFTIVQNYLLISL